MRNLVFLEKLANLIEARIEIFAVVRGDKIEDRVRDYEIYYGDQIRVFKLLIGALNKDKI